MRLLRLIKSRRSMYQVQGLFYNFTKNVYSAIYWALVILTEQAFLNRGRPSSPLPTSFESSAQDESRQRCIDAALRIWKLVEAYKKTFTLRRAQYGISYATYCAVLVILQHTDQACDEHIECIRFFWQALLEFQRGCNYGLKRPLRLLKSLMSRMERVTKNINIDAAAITVTHSDLSGMETPSFSRNKLMRIHSFSSRHECAFWARDWAG